MKANDLDVCPLCRTQYGHTIDCIEVAKTQPHTMINLDGEVFYPDDAEDAAYFSHHNEAYPLSPADFPY